jgi:hypothetical protein
MMTRKDYVRLAEVFRTSWMKERPPEDEVVVLSSEEVYAGAYEEGWNDATAHLLGSVMSVLASDNPRFDRGRFLEAARPPKGENA